MAQTSCVYQENEISIGKYEYENLIRESERLHVIERILKQNGYIATNDVKAVLGLKENEGA